MLPFDVFGSCCCLHGFPSVFLHWAPVSTGPPWRLFVKHNFFALLHLALHHRVSIQQRVATRTPLTPPHPPLSTMQCLLINSNFLFYPQLSRYFHRHHGWVTSPATMGGYTQALLLPRLPPRLHTRPARSTCQHHPFDVAFVAAVDNATAGSWSSVDGVRVATHRACMHEPMKLLLPCAPPCWLASDQWSWWT